MGKDPAKRRGALVIFAVMLALGLVYVLMGKKEPTKLPLPKKTDAVVAFKAGHEENLTKEQGEKVIALLKAATIESSATRDEIEETEYPESYQIMLNWKEQAAEIFYILPDETVYDPSEQRVYTLKEPIREELKKILNF
ncbi:MAG: hypothetical protein E7280_00625 [Lachnospiraceae bacterium]|nr:hypothetical protein [Lachnospiraceae bacterium]